MMISETEKLNKRLAELEEEIAETLRRVPAHSAKPAVMMDLLDLEDERELIITRLSQAQEDN